MNTENKLPVDKVTAACRLCVAPMMKWTDRHCRYFHRLLAPRSLLYTEMVTAAAIVYGKRADLLEFNREEMPVALQLGGSDPALLAQAALAGEQMGYNEINLNVGCPSPRVQSGAFGACLMAEPDLVARCVDAMIKAVSIPVTVKTRTGIDDSPGYEFLKAFIEKTRQAGCHRFIIHARKAWLSGLNPKENREIPPLEYSHVYRLKKEYPDLAIIINGGITKVEEIAEHLNHTDGVMLGRTAYYHPALLPAFEEVAFGTFDENRLTEVDLFEQLIHYADEQQARGVSFAKIACHLLHYPSQRPGARKFRQLLSNGMHGSTADSNLLREALKYI